MAPLWLWLATLALCALIWRVTSSLWLKPRSLEGVFRRQGIRGPPKSLLDGNVGDVMRMRAESEAKCMEGEISHDIVPYVLPHLVKWEKIYGLPFLMWWASEPSVVLKDLDMIREILYNKSGAFWRPTWQAKFQVDILGRGLVVSTGDEWAFRRRVLAPAFHNEKIKEMVASMKLSVSEMLEKWSSLTADHIAQLDVAETLVQLTSDIISRTAFGSSYKAGHKVFEHLEKLSKLVYKRFTTPWIFSLLPTSKVTRDLKTTKKLLYKSLFEIVQARMDHATLDEKSGAKNYGSDLLGIMLKEVDAHHRDEKSGITFTIDDLMEECKGFYVAGHETSARWLSWTMMLLASNPLWQDRAREEVARVCKSETPDAESLSKLKIVGMVLNESLRLYPPALFFVRSAFKDIKVGDVFFPRGSGVTLPILAILHDKEIWGDDANEFNPERFADGVANASRNIGEFPFLPFSIGPRVCLGQSFATTEGKLVVAMILQRFSFRLSPLYKHSPVHRLALQPQFGVPIIIQRVENSI